MRLLLDEHIPTGVAAELRARGHDAVAVAEDPELRGLPDADLWRAAGAAARSLVTYDVVGFLSLATHASLEGLAHPGLVLCSSRTLPPTRACIRPLVDALEGPQAGEVGPGAVAWLR